MTSIPLTLQSKRIQPLFFLLMAVILSSPAYSEDPAYLEDDPFIYDNEVYSANNEHLHNAVELGISIGYSQFEEEKEDGVNLHAHIMKRLSDYGVLRYFSIGAGIETILSTETHLGAMLSLGVHPTERWTISLSQGLEWANHDNQWSSNLASHIEASYLVEASGFHYGPILGYSKASDKQHYTIGIHFGVPLY